ncbi:MAG: LamG domain-containing protein [Opitutaceae bacterium]|jgi:hypothetical protein|nr:LamG domain-containing protein [Opitutaceae bacterium]
MKNHINLPRKGTLLALVTCACLPSVFADNYSSAVSDGNPVVYYRLGETAGTGTVASSGSASINGTVNSATPGATGPGGSTYPGFQSGNTGITFSGAKASNVSMDTYALAGQINGASAITAEMWINPTAFLVDSYSGSDLLSIPITSTGTFNAGLTIQLKANGDILLGGRSSSTEDKYENKTFSSTGVSLSTWTHLVAIFDYTGKSVSLYINGQQVGSTLSVAWDSNTLSIGGNASTVRYSKLGGNDQTSVAVNPFNGSMDEFALYSRALSETEVLAHYNAAITAAVPEPSSGGALAGGIAFAVAALLLVKRRHRHLV